MKKTISCNISGMIFNIEEPAYNKLSAYLDSLKNQLAHTEGREEIYADIELRIAELFTEKIGVHRQVITEEDINEVITILGKPEEYIEEGDMKIESEEFSQFQSTKKQFMRDTDNALIGGVCGGISSYFGIDLTLVRALFVLMFFLTGFGFMLYIVLWIITPKASTSADKLRMQGKPITERPKDSHDIVGVFRQAIDPGWANQTMSTGEPVLQQLRERHADQMRERPEVMPGQFKTQVNRAGNTLLVAPRLVRGTLIEASKILPTVPVGLGRALFAMFMVSEIHPFTDGNGRLARLVMNAELSVVNRYRIIIPTLYREEYLDCLRVLTREGDPKPFLNAMQWIQAWTAAFDYEDLDRTIDSMASCNAFERSRIQHKLLMPTAL
jgi:phage shock protein PspC (stress-responsive transcriptional regulator)